MRLHRLHRHQLLPHFILTCDINVKIKIALRDSVGHFSRMQNRRGDTRDQLADQKIQHNLQGNLQAPHPIVDLRNQAEFIAQIECNTGSAIYRTFCYVMATQTIGAAKIRLGNKGHNHAQFMTTVTLQLFKLHATGLQRLVIQRIASLFGG